MTLGFGPGPEWPNEYTAFQRPVWENPTEDATYYERINVPLRVRRADITRLRVRMLEAIIRGDSFEAYGYARWLCRYSEVYLYQEAHRILPRF